MSLSARIKLTVTADLTKALDLGEGESPISRTFLQLFADGVGADQADRIFHDRRTLAASATEDLDLAGSLVDVYGATITLARLKAIIVMPAEANTNNVNVIRPAANGVPIFLAAGDGVPVAPGGLFAHVAGNAAGIVVTPGTGELLTFTNSSGGTPVTYDVIVIGASA